ncbi:hypothetical protein CPY53_10870 [Paenibacillus polymyxa]|uniref:hypothetical protein n=2 Tax=Paenibacillus polymyxa TaxID=1406 RepID=UPI001F58BCEB|nr:hypothetical protein [Paenibacillus polymyxa]UNL94013.1 hypothetical protein CPY53_10870 [Paenibacillus polymyxa]
MGSQPTNDSHLEMDLLAIGKRIGLSFTEINDLRCQDLIDLARSFTGSDNEEETKEATQDDIDAFYGR